MHCDVRSTGSKGPQARFLLPYLSRMHFPLGHSPCLLGRPTHACPTRLKSSTTLARQTETREKKIQPRTHFKTTRRPNRWTCVWYNNVSTLAQPVSTRRLQRIHALFDPRIKLQQPNKRKRRNSLESLPTPVTCNTDSKESHPRPIQTAFLATNSHLQPCLGSSCPHHNGTPSRAAVPPLRGGAPLRTMRMPSPPAPHLPPSPTCPSPSPPLLTKRPLDDQHRLNSHPAAEAQHLLTQQQQRQQRQQHHAFPHERPPLPQTLPPPTLLTRPTARISVMRSFGGACWPSSKNSTATTVRG